MPMRVMYFLKLQKKMFASIFQNFLEERDKWFLWVPVLFGAGCASYFALPSSLNFWWLILIFEAVLVLLYFTRHRFSFFIVLSSFFVFVLGFCYMSAYSAFWAKKLSIPSQKETIYISGRIKQIDKTKTGKVRLWLEDVHDFENKRQGIYRISVRQKKAFKIGTCVETAATVFAPAHALVPGGFDFARHAFFQGVAAVGYAECHVFETECGTKPSLFSTLKTDLNQIRANVTNSIVQTLNPNEAAVAAAVLVGNKNMLTKKLYDRYRNAGLAHFLAISGFHIGLVGAFAFLTLRFLLALIPYFTLRYNIKNMACVFAIAISFVYLLLSGCSVPAVRAFIMEALVFLAVIYDKNPISLRMVACAAMVVLILEPFVIVSAGFQMSFSAVVALIAFYDFAKKKFKTGKNKKILYRIASYFIGIIATTTVATLATAPYVIYHFGTFAPYAILGNLLAMPVIMFFVMPTVFLSLLFLPLHLNTPFLKMSGYGLYVLENITRYISTKPFANLSFSFINIYALILITLGGLWLCLWQNKWRRFGFVFIIFGCLTGVFYQKPDAFYLADGKTVAIEKSKNELLIFAKKFNAFDYDVLSKGYRKTTYIKHLKSIPDIGLVCFQKECVYKDVLRFDLKGKIILSGQVLNPQEDLGGAVYIKGNKVKVKTVKASLKNKPWG